MTGNANGQGGTPSLKIFNSLIPLPPIPGPEIPNVTTLQIEKLFWFDPDPVATILTQQLKDPNSVQFWRIIFLDILYETTANALDIPGGTPIAPILDLSIVADIDLSLPFPEIIIQATLPKLTPPELPDLGIKFPPEIPLPPIPPIPPNIPLPSFDVPLPSLVLPDLLIGLISLPFDVILKLFKPELPDIPGLPKLVLELAINLVIELLIKLNLLLIVPKVFIASLIVYIKNVVGMVCTDIVGMILGAGGALTGGIAKLTGLILG